MQYTMHSSESLRITTYKQHTNNKSINLFLDLLYDKIGKKHPRFHKPNNTEPDEKGNGGKKKKVSGLQSGQHITDVNRVSAAGTAQVHAG